MLVDLKRVYTPSTATIGISSLEDVIGSLLNKEEIDLSIKVGDFASEHYIKVIAEDYANKEICPLLFSDSGLPVNLHASPQSTEIQVHVHAH